MISSEIFEIIGAEDGPVVAIFAGMHGDELAGVLALKKLLPNLTVTKGRAYIAFANPPAIQMGVRMINKNLNRCFFAGNQGAMPEDKRARELMAVLDTCDALLDLHMFYDDNGVPFAICEDNAVDLVSKFDLDIISTNWSHTEPGAADGYMYMNGKIGICVECGPISKAADYTGFATQTIYQFLRHFGMTDKPITFSTKPKRIIKAEKTIYKTSERFVLKGGLGNFDALQPGQVIATESGKQYVAKARECVIFPHYKARVGEEACIIGAEEV